MNENDERVGGVRSVKVRHFSTEELIQVQQLLDLEQEFLEWVDRLAKIRGNSRNLSLVRTNVEQAVMWGLKEVVGSSFVTG